MEQWSSLAHVQKQLAESQAQEVTAKKYASRYFQLKVGHGAVGTYLARIGVIETPQCWCCGQAEQSVVYLLPSAENGKRNGGNS